MAGYTCFCCFLYKSGPRLSTFSFLISIFVWDPECCLMIISKKYFDFPRFVDYGRILGDFC